MKSEHEEPIFWAISDCIIQTKYLKIRGGRSFDTIVSYDSPQEKLLDVSRKSNLVHTSNQLSYDDEKVIKIHNFSCFYSNVAELSHVHSPTVIIYMGKEYQLQKCRM